MLNFSSTEVNISEGSGYIIHCYMLYRLLLFPEHFDPFLKAYIEKFQGDSIVTNQWKDFLFSYFKDKVKQISFL